MTKTLNEWKEFAAEKPFTSKDMVFDILNDWEEDISPKEETWGTCSFCNNDGEITKDPLGSMCDKCWEVQLTKPL